MAGSSSVSSYRSNSQSERPRALSAIVNKDVLKYSIMDQLQADATYALRKSIDDVLANSGVSPTGYQARSQKLEHRSNSLTPVDNSGTMAPNWSRGAYPRSHASIENVDSTSQETNYPDRLHSGALATDDMSTMPRKSADGVTTNGISRLGGLAVYSAHQGNTGVLGNAFYTDTGRSGETATGSQWQRRGYPLQQSRHVMPSSREIASSQRTPNSALSASPSQIDASSVASSDISSSNASLQTDQSALGVHQSTPHTSISTLSTGSGQPESERQVHKYARSGYPLQRSTSRVPVQVIDIPPRGTKAVLSDEHSPVIISSESTSKRKGRTHRGYPLQSPASTLMLRSPSSPTTLDVERPVPDQQMAAAPPIYSHEAQSSSLADKQRSLGRYLMQHTPSVGGLRLLSESHQPSVDSQQATTLLTSNTSKPKSFRRGIYPMQHLPSLIDLKDTSEHQNLSTAYRKCEAASNNESNATAQAHQDESKDVAISLNKCRESTTGTTSSRDSVIAEAAQRWRRQPYPLQRKRDEVPGIEVVLPPSESPQSAQPGPDASHSDFGQNESPHSSTEQVHLPKNIRAELKSSPDSTSDDTHSQHKRNGRTIIVCLDGTGDKFDNDNSNIVQLVSALKKDDPAQVSYYQAGIGTYNKGGLNTGFSSAMDRAVGSELGLHVRDAYQFLMHSYKEGDKICIFGFSRGAYTARCVAGMVHKVGLLPPRNYQQIAFAYGFYADSSDEGWHQSRLFKETFSIDVSVYFLGAFDSVASVGIIPRQLPLSTTPTNKSRYFRHAMALDERRAKFKVCRYETAKDLDDLENQSNPDDDDSVDDPSHQQHPIYGAKYHPNMTNDEYSRIAEPEAAFNTDIKEVWFAGAHADIGGGAVGNDQRHKLSQIPLRWMIRQCFECNTGIKFKTKALAEFGLDVHTLWPEYRSLPIPSLHGPPPTYLEKYTELPPRSIRGGKLLPTWQTSSSHSTAWTDRPSKPPAKQQAHTTEPLYHFSSPTDPDWTPEQVEDYYDSLSQLNDQLVQAPNWWILELLPVPVKIPTGDGQVKVVNMANWGRYRGVGDREPLVHWTVRQREESLTESGGYKVQVRTGRACRWKVVV